MSDTLISAIREMFRGRAQYEQQTLLNQERRDLIQRQIEEEARRRDREDLQAGDVDLARQVNLVDLLRRSAAGTPVEMAPRADVEDLALQAGVEPFSADVASFAPAAEVPDPGPRRGVMMKLRDGREIPLAPLKYEQEVKAAELVDAKAKHDAQSDVMDVPDDKETFGTLAGQKGVRTSTVNSAVAAQARKDAASQQAESKKAAVEAKTVEAQQKKEADAEAGRVVAESWFGGTSFPSTQKDTNAALKYFDANKEDYPRVPRKLNALQQTEVLGATKTLGTLDEVKLAYAQIKDKNKIGPGWYTIQKTKQALPFFEADPEFTQFQRLLTGMNNLEIKYITGAQMSEAEAGRLLQGLATGDLKPKDFEAALKVMERNAKRNKEIVLFGDYQKESTPGAAVVAPVETQHDALLKKYGY